LTKEVYFENKEWKLEGQWSKHENVWKKREMRKEME
jgi:hypothetical protein